MGRLSGPKWTKIRHLGAPKLTKIDRFGTPKSTKIGQLGGPELTKIGGLGAPKMAKIWVSAVPAEGHEPHGTALPAPCEGTSHNARIGKRGGHAGAGQQERGQRERAHQHTKGTRHELKGPPDHDRGTHRPHGMAYQRARTRETGSEQPATPTTEAAANTRGQGGGGRAQNGTGPTPDRVRREHASRSVSQGSSQSGSQLGKQAGRQAGRNTQFGFFQWWTTATNNEESISSRNRQRSSDRTLGRRPSHRVRFPAGPLTRRRQWTTQLFFIQPQSFLPNPSEHKRLTPPAHPPTPPKMWYPVSGVLRPQNQKNHRGIVLSGKIMMLQLVGHPISCLGVCYANDPQNGGGGCGVRACA